MVLLTAASAAALAASAATPRVSAVCCLATSNKVRAADERAWKTQRKRQTMHLGHKIRPHICSRWQPPYTLKRFIPCHSHSVILAQQVRVAQIKLSEKKVLL